MMGSPRCKIKKHGFATRLKSGLVSSGISIPRAWLFFFALLVASPLAEAQHLAKLGSGFIACPCEEAGGSCGAECKKAIGFLDENGDQWGSHTAATFAEVFDYVAYVQATHTYTDRWQRTTSPYCIGCPGDDGGATSLDGDDHAIDVARRVYEEWKAKVRETLIDVFQALRNSPKLFSGPGGVLFGYGNNFSDVIDKLNRLDYMLNESLRHGEATLDDLERALQDMEAAGNRLQSSYDSLAPEYRHVLDHGTLPPDPTAPKKEMKVAGTNPPEKTSHPTQNRRKSGGAEAGFSYSGANAQVVRHLLGHRRCPRWSTGPNEDGTPLNPPEFNLTPSDPIRDTYIAAATNFAWAAEAFARTGQGGRAEDAARQMMSELRKARELCSTGPSFGSSGSKTAYITCDWLMRL